jgi:hypothetical protein
MNRVFGEGESVVYHPVVPDKHELDFFHCDCALLTNFDTAFATQALILVHRFRLTIDQFIYIDGANIHAFSVASAFVLVNRYFKAHFYLHLSFENSSTIASGIVLNPLLPVLYSLSRTSIQI